MPPKGKTLYYGMYELLLMEQKRPSSARAAVRGTGGSHELPKHSQPYTSFLFAFSYYTYSFCCIFIFIVSGVPGAYIPWLCSWYYLVYK